MFFREIDYYLSVDLNLFLLFGIYRLIDIDGGYILVGEHIKVGLFF
jgi:hypothetical protein